MENMKDIKLLIINSYTQKPRDVVTIPIGNRIGKWFNVRVENDKLVISAAKEHANTCNFKMQRTLNLNECEKVFDLYLKLQKGIITRKQVRDQTVNGSYWLGIFYDLDL